MIAFDAGGFDDCYKEHLCRNTLYAARDTILPIMIVSPVDGDRKANGNISQTVEPPAPELVYLCGSIQFARPWS